MLACKRGAGDEEGVSRLRDKFPGYYRRSEGELDQIWQDGLVVFDANVLLNLYRYSEGTRDELLEVLRGAQHQLWLPYQVAEEFHRDRLTVIRTQKKAYSAIRESLKKAEHAVVETLGNMHRDPGIIEAKDLRKKIDESFEELIAEAKTLEGGADTLRG
jgi:hypothetical protein